MMFRTIENHHAPKANKSSGFRILPINSYDKLTTNALCSLLRKPYGTDDKYSPKPNSGYDKSFRNAPIDQSRRLCSERADKVNSYHE